MQITDEMVEAALEAAKNAFFLGHPADKAKQMRAALEAALVIGAGKAADIISDLPTNEACRWAAACIEDLAGALKECLQSHIVDVSGKAWPILMRNERDRARATLERWGLK